ncbi:MAG: tRNA preQ1(34) S-adenosylmethionine ribosyltransferase-isomerase QueA [Sedimentisphaerales bacterium]|nr:tRNA preQ1(34) S-adenosylmethionine ribosyltransferase-isomerase QueA [Sedimentisphaerales bacterium]
MRTEQFDYDLPRQLIAQHPAAVRSASRLLVVDRSRDELIDSRFDRLGDFLRAGDCLVLNDTKVLPARFFARRQSGAALEGLFLAGREHESGVWEVMLKGAHKVAVAERIILKDREQRDFCQAELLGKRGGICLIRPEAEGSPECLLDEIGFPPLPPYIRRDHDPVEAQHDRQRYQTVYARQPGAVAAPTAGLHFSDELITQLKGRGVVFAWVTLHVGTGTFKPVTTENLEDHEIHREWFRVSAADAKVINATRRAGGRIVAVGTTATRVLETVATDSQIEPGQGTTDLFITPGYEFKVVDAMITNFHLPRTTLLALVAAFAGLDRTLAAYHHAVAQRYRFYSYGDAMLIL